MLKEKEIQVKCGWLTFLTFQYSAHLLLSISYIVIFQYIFIVYISKYKSYIGIIISTFSEMILQDFPLQSQYIQ